MTLAQRKPMTLPEFLDWEQTQELRYEFDGCQPIALSGGTAAHAAIQRNLAVSLGGRLRGRPRRFYGSDLKIEVVGRSRYPDGFVVCSDVPPASAIVENPVVIFEILSPSTSGTDRIVKTREYQATTSVRRYVILEQDRIAATVFARVADDWGGHVLADDAVLAMPEIEVDVPLAELYEGLVFEAANDAEEAPSTVEWPPLPGS